MKRSIDWGVNDVCRKKKVKCWENREINNTKKLLACIARKTLQSLRAKWKRSKQLFKKANPGSHEYIPRATRYHLVYKRDSRLSKSRRAATTRLSSQARAHRCWTGITEKEKILSEIYRENKPKDARRTKSGRSLVENSVKKIQKYSMETEIKKSESVWKIPASQMESPEGKRIIREGLGGGSDSLEVEEEVEIFTLGYFLEVWWSREERKGPLRYVREQKGDTTYFLYIAV